MSSDEKMQSIHFDDEKKNIHPRILRSFIKAKRAIAVTGAGISVPSGIPASHDEKIEPLKPLIDS